MSEAIEDDLVRLMVECTDDPYKFVLRAFPWGEPGELENYDGPDVWQAEILKSIRDNLKHNKPIRLAVTSGHGIGKSALVSWLVLWSLATREYTRGVVTANTQVQLMSKTWAELARWHRLFIAKHWLRLNATSIAIEMDGEEKSWRVDAIPWSESRTEAFAGLHNQGKRIIVIMDEASAIPDVIWETTEGALTDKDTQIIWAAFGNPTRNTGRFRECFGKFKHLWNGKQIDSRNAKMANQEQIAEWQTSYGDDSDFFRVRVKGEFPRAGSMQFIPGDIVEDARKREPVCWSTDPVVMGVDCARFGDDMSVIVVRRGRDASSIPWFTYRNIDTMTLAAKIVELAREYKPDQIFVDGGGVGGGVIDRLNALRQPVVEVQFAGKADRSSQVQEGSVVYANKRAEIWGYMKEWLKGGSIPDDPNLATDLTGLEYGYIIRDGRDAILLEKKEDMKKRGLASPDLADALALTFSYPVQPSVHVPAHRQKDTHQIGYNPLGREHVTPDLRQSHQIDYNSLARRIGQR